MAPALTSTTSQTRILLPGCPPPFASENRLQEHISVIKSQLIVDQLGVSKTDFQVCEQLPSDFHKYQQYQHCVPGVIESKENSMTYRNSERKCVQPLELAQNPPETECTHSQSFKISTHLFRPNKNNYKSVEEKMNQPAMWNNTNGFEKLLVNRCHSHNEKMQNGHLDNCNHDSSLLSYEKSHTHNSINFTRTEKLVLKKSKIMCLKSDVERKSKSFSNKKKLRLNNNVSCSKLTGNNNKITIVEPMGLSDKEFTVDNSSAADRLNVAERNLCLLEKRSQFLLRRLRMLQSRKLDGHVKSQLKAFVDFQHQNLQSAVSKVIWPFNDKPNTFFNCDDVKNLSTSNLVTLVRNLQAKPKLTIENNKKTEGILVMDRIVSAESEKKSGHLQACLRHWIASVDSDATESSSGGESCEEWEDCPVITDKKVPTPLYKHAEWKWSVERAAIVARWTWLQTQVSDLEYKIRQHSDIHRTIRNSKGVVALCDLPVIGPAGDTGLIFNNCSDMSSTLRLATLMIDINNQSSKLSQSGNCLIPVNTINNKIENSSKCLNGIVDSTSSTQQKNPNTPASDAGLSVSSDLKAVLDLSCVAARCRQVKSYRKRKLLRTAGLYQINAKAARLSSVKCQCYPPIMPCSLCGGRYNNLQRLDAEGMSVMEKVSLLDSAFHPVLSFPQEIALSIHFEALLKSGEWQTSKAADKLSVQRITEENSRQKLKEQARKSSNKSAAALLLNSAKLRVKYDRKSTNKRIKKRVFAETQLKRKDMKRRRMQLLNVAVKNSLSYDTDTNSMSTNGQNDTQLPHMKDSVLSHSSSSATLKDLKDSKKKKVENAYDINNIVIPHNMAASTRVEKLQYKEIQTPKWREVGQEESEGQEFVEGEEVEDLNDNAFLNRHEICESEERKKFRNFITFPHVRRSRLSRESECNTHDSFSPDSSLNDTHFDNGFSVNSGREDGRRRSCSTSRRSSFLDECIWDQVQYCYEVEHQDPWPLRQFPLPEELYEEMKNEVVTSVPIITYRRRETVRMPDDLGMEFVSPECDNAETLLVSLSPEQGNELGISSEDDDPEWNGSHYE